MQSDNKTTLSDYARLKVINSELSIIAHQKKECRSKTSIFGGIAGVLLAVSMIALFQNLLSKNNDWQINANSPVYEEASQDQASTVVIVLSGIGIVVGVGLFFVARGKCTEANTLNDNEKSLVGEMRMLRDKMYVKEQQKSDHKFKPKNDQANQPLGPDDARNEYVGVYSPPGSHKGV
ncbi:MAG: hypothetical protein C0631_10160 [Sedimenticola sp.]|jgi:hypothetical protein|nr:MAG: hypothetical protein C0631_10160 [Sedimenticola sp.]